MSTTYLPDPRWPELGAGFSDPVQPAAFPRHTLRWRNDRAAAEVGLDHLDDAAWVAHFARFEPLPGNLPAPLALRYHGHQFRHYNPHLGDGRGFLYAQLRDTRGRLLDLGTKGSGTTPWSRGGDGKLTLKGGVREILASELLEALGVPTCRTFSIVETGEELDRHDEPSPTRGCVMVRLSHSHVRFGSFQRLAALGDRAGMERLLAYTMEHYGTRGGVAEGTPSAPKKFLTEVCRAKAWTVGAWMAAGFVHGVLNTDNMNVTGESFDYGPWRFAPTVDPDFTAAYFDGEGLYAYGRQAEAVYWNLHALARALSLLGEPLDGALDGYAASFHAGFRATSLRRLGVLSEGEAADTALVESAFGALARTQMEIDTFFHDAYGGGAADARIRASDARAQWDLAPMQEVREILEGYRPRHPERLADPDLAEPPVDLHIGTVEALWATIAERDDWEPLYAHLARIRRLGARLDGEPPIGA